MCSCLLWPSTSRRQAAGWSGLPCLGSNVIPFSLGDLTGRPPDVSATEWAKRTAVNPAEDWAAQPEAEAEPTAA